MYTERPGGRLPPTGSFTRQKIVELMRKVHAYQAAHPYRKDDRNWIRATYYTGDYLNNGVLEREEFLPVVMKAWNGLVRHVQPDGKLGFVQPVGASPKPATAEMTHQYAMGLFLSAGSEMAKLAESGEGDARAR